MSKKKLLFIILPLILLTLGIVFLIVSPIKQVENAIGAPAPEIGPLEKFETVRALQPRLAALTDPLDNDHGKSILEIEPGDNTLRVAAKLQQAGFSLDPLAFTAYILFKGKAGLLQVGSFGIPAGITIPELAEMLTDPGSALVTFAFLPGMRLEEIAELIDNAGLAFSGEEFLKAAQNYPPEAHPYGGTSLEGCMIPDSYKISRSISLEAFLQGFAARFGKEIVGKYADAFTENGLSVEQAVIMASLVAREAISPEEYPMIASVFYNRWNIAMSLGSDASVQYAVGKDDGDNWWKSPLSAEDLDIDSPYNTYIYSGFPPGPICSPDTTVFDAVAYPAKSNYYYFQAKCDGTPYHNFAVTYAEHFANNCQ